MTETDPISPSGRRAFAIAVFGIAVAIIGMAIAAFPLHRHPKALRVGFKEVSPYISVGSDGKPAGLAVDVLTEAARRSGQRLSWTAVEDGEGALKAGTIDVYPLLIATPERVARFHFSESWWQSSPELVSPQRNPLNRAADASGKRIGVQMRGQTVRLAQSLFPWSRLIVKPHLDALVDSLCKGEIDAVFVDTRSIERALIEHPPPCRGLKLKFTGVPGANQLLGTASTRSARNRADLLYTHIYETVADGTLAALASNYALPSPQSNQHLTRLEQDRQSRFLLTAGGTVLGVLVLVFIFITLRIRFVRRAASEARLKLEDSEQRFHAFMNNLTANAFMKDRDGRLVFLNNTDATLFSLTPEECLGKTNFDIMPEAVAEQLRANDQLVLKTDRAHQFTEAIPDRSGRLRHWLAHKFPVHSRSGEVFLGGISIEITEMVAARNALRESESRYRQIVEYAGDIILRCDARGRVSYINDMGARVLKISPARLRGRRAQGLIRREERPRVIGILREKLQENATDFYIEVPVTQGDGAEIWLGQTIRVLRTDGRFAGFQAISRDITERRRMEAELRASEERFRLLYENSPVAYHEIDTHGVIRRANRAEGEMLGIPMTELVGRSVLDLMVPDEREIARAAITAKFAGQLAIRPFHRTYLRADGRRVKVEIHENVTRDETGELISIHSVLLDVTEKHLAEIREHDRREISEMIAQQQPLDRILCGISRMIGHQNENLRCIPVPLTGEDADRRMEPVCCDKTTANLCQAIGHLDREAGWWPPVKFRQVDLRWAELELNAASASVVDAARELDMHSCWSTPILSGSRTSLGWLLVFSRGNDNLTEQERRLLDAASRLAAIAIEHRYMTDLLAFQAGHDCLTRLPNRCNFEQRLEDAITKARKHSEQLAVFFVDLDRFKQVNDTLGHSGGDELLRQVAHRLRRCLRRNDLLARIGGDEFSVVVPGLVESNEAHRVADALLRAFRAPFEIDGSEVYITASIGISLYPQDGLDATTLQRNSDSAMYRVKNMGKNGFRCFAGDSPATAKRAPSTLAIN